eukprot:CAMPEP_0170908140 /NCGR_PEP_ID=MMETSP0735-20130129/1740_1 /TAXON_ID=186038 /ORGANISM="Fragilariopsis kerguelensis, Strain L26-C5" /LENGTH=429 /DNA_ID=CAMNT_0011304431 /DNA_START=23 /DNA_END=1312 /DNA_ORIENTATION=-
MNISGIAPVIKKGLNVVGALFAGGRVHGNDVESDPHAANNDQRELNGGRNRSSSTEIPSCDEEEDEKKKNSSRIDAAEVAAPADTIAAASTNDDISIAATIDAEKLQATHTSIATTNIAKQTEPKSPSAEKIVTFPGTKYSGKKRRRKRSRGSPDASTTSFSSVVNYPRSISSPPNSNRKNQQRKQTMAKKASPKDVRVCRTKPSPLAMTAMEKAPIDDVFDFPIDDKSSTHTPSKSRNVPTTFAVKAGAKVDASGHTMNQKVERDSTEVDVIQPPTKRQKLSKQSQETSFPCRNFPATRESEHSSEIDSPVESTTASSSEEMKDSVQGNSSQMDEESTPDKSTTNSIPESVKGSDAEPVDIAYQNMKSQTQCRATKEGRIWRPKGKWGRCQNCVEGVFQYCYAHRNLDMDQDRYWAQRYNKKYVSVLA